MLSIFHCHSRALEEWRAEASKQRFQSLLWKAHQSGANFQVLRRLPGSLGLKLRSHCMRARSEGNRSSTAMALLQFPSLVSPAANIGIVAVAFLCIWIMSYVLDWLRILEAGTRAREQMPALEDPSSLASVQFPSIFGISEKYISLIIPAYNEEARLSSTLDETLQYLLERAKQDKSFTYEIIIVDDGSTDNTAKVAFEYVKRFKVDLVRVLKLGTNQGKGAAVRKGMLCSRGQILLMLDADGATRFTDLEKLESEMNGAIKTIASKNSSTSTDARLGQTSIAVFGSRAGLEKQALATRKWYRNILTKGFKVFVFLVAGPSKIRDTQCGFKLFTRSAARQVFLNMRLKRFSFDVELLYLCNRLHIPVLEVPVTWTEMPGSKVRVWSILHMMFELVLVRLGYGFHVWKIHQRAALD